jgi:putative ABC transport system substrate-binding protein
MNATRRGVLVFVLAFLHGRSALYAQTVTKPARIGVLVHGQPVKAYAEALRQGLADLGYVEGRTLAIEWHSADGKHQLESLAVDLARRKVDVIVTAGTPAARAARQATSSIPIVMAVSGDPVGAGLVASLARPGGNITGLSSLAHGAVTKQLQLLSEALPLASRFAILLNPDNTAHAGQVQDAQAGARQLKVEMQVVPVRDLADLDQAFGAMARHRTAGLVVLADLFFLAHAARLADLTARHRLPAVYALSEHVKAGGLMAYGTSRRDMHRRAAALVDKILRGAKPADLPVEQATTFEFAVNLKAAKSLGYAVPQSLLVRADEVIAD